MKNNLTKFLAGAAAGAGLAVAANKYLESDAGKKTSEGAKKMWLDFEKISKSKYKRIQKLSEEKVEDLIDKTLKMWDEFLEKEV
jgi:gas vesicle protein